MPSLIDITKPIYGTPTTQSVRDNFNIAQQEITALQAITNTGPFVPLAGGPKMTGFFELYNDPRGNFEPATKQYVDAIAFGASGSLPDAPKDGLFYVRGGAPTPASSNDWFTDPIFTSLAVGVDGKTKSFGLRADATNNYYDLFADGTDTIRYNTTTKILDFVFAGAVTAKFSTSAITFSKHLLVGDGSQSAPSYSFTSASGAGLYYFANIITMAANNKDLMKWSGSGNGSVTVPVEMIMNVADKKITMNSVAGAHNFITGQKGSITKWIVDVGNHDAESGSNAGSNFGIVRLSDTGVNLDTSYAFKITRSTGVVSFANNVRIELDPATNSWGTISGRSANPTIATNDVLILRSRSDVASSVVTVYGPTYGGIYSNSVILGNDATSKYWSFRQDGEATFPGGITLPGLAGLYWINSNQRIGYDPSGAGYFFIDMGVVAGGVGGNRFAFDGTSFNWMTNNYTLNMSLSKDGVLNVPGQIATGSFLLNNSFGFSIGYNGGYTYVTFFPNFFIQGVQATGNWIFYQSNSTTFEIRNGTKDTVTWTGPSYATAFNPVSDIRLKDRIEPSTHGLAEILKINPILFYRNDENPSRKETVVPPTVKDEGAVYPPTFPKRQELGFSAQNVMDALEIAVVKIEQDEPDSMLAISIVPILAALVNAVKEMDARLKASNI